MAKWSLCAVPDRIAASEEGETPAREHRASVRQRALGCVLPGALACLLAFEVASAGLAMAEESGWDLQSPLPTGQHLRAAWGTAPVDVYAVGYGGTVLHYDSTTWSYMNSGTTQNLLGVWGSGSNDIFAVGSGGTIVHYDGSTWSPMVSGTVSFLNDAWGTGPNSVFVAGNSGTILHYDGASWVQMTSGTFWFLYGIWGSGPNDVWAVGEHGTILRYGGLGWSPQTSGTANCLYGVWGSGPNDVFVVGEKSTILHFDGTIWSPMVSGVDELLRRVWGYGPNEVFALGYYGNFLQYDGTTWWPRATLTSGIWSAWGAGPNDVFAVGSYGKLFRYDGSAWSSMNRGTPYTLYSVWSSGVNDLFAVGRLGTIMRSDGTEWLPVASGTTLDLYGVWGREPNGTFVVGNAGTVLHCDGASWSLMSSGTTNDLRAVWGADASHVFAVGASGTIIRCDGSVWSGMPSGTTNTLCGVWGSSADDVFAVGNSGTIVHYDGSGWSALASGTTVNLNAVWGSGPNSVFAVGLAETLLHYDGLVWSPMRISSGDLYAIWGTGPDRIFAAGSGGLFGYKESGSWWTAIAGPGGRLRGVCGAEPNEVFVVGENGYIARGLSPHIPVWPAPDPNRSAPFRRGGYAVVLLGSFDSGYEQAQQSLVRETYMALTQNLAVDPCNVWVLANQGEDSWTQGLFDALPATRQALSDSFQTIGQRMWNDANCPRNLFFAITGHGGRTNGLGCDVGMQDASLRDADLVANYLNRINLAGNGSCPIEGLDVVVTTCYGGGFIDDLRSNFHTLRGLVWPNAVHFSIMTASDVTELSYLMFAIPLLTDLRNGGQDVSDLNEDGVLSIFEYYDHAAKYDPANPEEPYTPYVPGTLYVQGVYHLGASEHPLYYEWNGYALNLSVVNDAWGTIQLDPPSIEPNRLCYAAGTQVTLTGLPNAGKVFNCWTIWEDPNHHGDANFAVQDTNSVLHLTMNRDYAVDAAFKCGSGLPPLLAAVPLVLTAGVVLRRARMLARLTPHPGARPSRPRRIKSISLES